MWIIGSSLFAIGQVYGTAAPIYLPGFFQQHNLLPFHKAFIVPPDSEHPHHADKVVLVGESRTPSGSTQQTAVDLATGELISDYKFANLPIADQTSAPYKVEESTGSLVGDSWRIAFDKDEGIVQISDASILTSFPAKTSPEGQVRWKFLDKNSVSVLTESELGTSLRVVRTGNVVGNFFFPQVSAAKMLFKDNVVIIHGYNRKYLRHELYVVSLFWTSESEISVWDLVSKTPSYTAVTSDITRFIFPWGNVTHMEISKTRNFLAPATLIFALADGRIVRKSLPEISALSDSSEVVDFDGVDILTRGNFLSDRGQVSAIVTGPTMLESTSAVVVIGNFGLFISKVASPLAFDSLDGGAFDVEMLVTSLAVVGAIFVASEVLARRAMRLRKWK